MQHFFLPFDSFNGSEIVFPPQTSRQIIQVLRLKPEAHVIVLDGSGKEFEVALVIARKTVTGKIVSSQISHREAAVQLHLFFALSQRERVEMILQKCTEVGVVEFTPLITSRTLVQDKKSVEKKRERWQAIIREAAEQSERSRLPKLNSVLSFSEALSSSRPDELKILAWEQEENQSIHSILENYREGPVSLMIGPEGGFSEEEASLAKAAGWRTVTLGKRVLRMETAAIVASALVIDSNL
jgi:16S rRNA (uracil1498-N3)-methyltransferase